MKIICANPNCGRSMHSLKLKTGFGGSWQKYEDRWFCNHRCYFRFRALQFIKEYRGGMQRTVRRVKLGLLLVKNNLVDPDTLRNALEEQANSLKKLGEILVETGKITHSELKSALSMQAGMAPVNLAPDFIIKAKKIIPVELIEEYHFACCRFDEKEKIITFAIYDIEKMSPIQDIFSEVYPGFLLKFYLTDKENLLIVLGNNYPSVSFKVEEHHGDSDEWRENSELEKVVYKVVDFLNAGGALEVDIEGHANAVRIKTRLQTFDVDVKISK